MSRWEACSYLCCHKRATLHTMNVRFFLIQIPLLFFFKFDLVFFFLFPFPTTFWFSGSPHSVPQLLFKFDNPVLVSLRHRCGLAFPRDRAPAQPALGFPVLPTLTKDEELDCKTPMSRPSLPHCSASNARDLETCV